MVSHEHKDVGTAQGGQHDRLGYLTSLIHHTVVEAPVRKERVLHSQAGAAHHPGKGYSESDPRVRLRCRVIREKAPKHVPVLCECKV